MSAGPPGVVLDGICGSISGKISLARKIGKKPPVPVRPRAYRMKMGEDMFMREGFYS